jgi:hypothetical protein
MCNCQCNHKNDELNEIIKDENATPKIKNTPIENSENLNNEIYNKKIDYKNYNERYVNTKEDFNYVDDNRDNQKSDQLKNSNDNIIENNNNNSGNRTNDIDYKDKNIRINHDDNNNNNNYNSNDNNNNNDNYNNNNNHNDNGNSFEENVSQNNENKNIFDHNLTPNDEFSKYIFENINNIRTDPKSYISKIRESENNITKDKKDRLIYKSKVKVALTKGLKSFEEAIDLLNETEPMNKLIFDPKLTIPLPETEDEIKDKNYLKEKVQELIKKRSVKSYWRDIVKEKETSFLLSIVDDTGEKSGMKRKNILNPIIKYIGINSILIGKTFACYILLSDKDK